MSRPMQQHQRHESQHRCAGRQQGIDQARKSYCLVGH
jgi:hypothetical protein